MTITRSTTFLHGKALMPGPSDSRGRKKVLALMCGSGDSKTFSFCAFKVSSFSSINLRHKALPTPAGSQLSLCHCILIPPTHPKALSMKSSLVSFRGKRTQQKWMKYLWWPHPLQVPFQIPVLRWLCSELSILFLACWKELWALVLLTLVNHSSNAFLSFPKCIQSFKFNLPELESLLIFLH